ncbi:FMN reductase [Ciceribacter naphthalenivorans]|uniref:FMN reductase n=3 Tax=Pseudomonadota TaxID=1224 RepID=A0A512HNG3_9HYPH|nr:FMN reductase [Ciceribacter naphthalenivorans]GLR23326.1 FMN reductase [Ciceribacter naphthalenivorans]GLT06182.1 FMN reductase [Sphingomonas psychrolutea]
MQSTGQKALAHVLARAAERGARTELISGPALDLPLYSPDTAERSEAAARLVALMRECDGVVICSPAYHGSVSGLVKNAIDYTEDMNRDARVYFDGLPVGCIACGAGWQAAGQTLAALRAIAHALRGWPTPMGGMINSTQHVFDAEGTCVDASVRFQLDTIADQVTEFALRKARVEQAQSTMGG